MNCRDGRSEAAGVVGLIEPPLTGLKMLLIGPLGLSSAEVTLKRPLRWTTGPSDVSSADGRLFVSLLWRYNSGPL